MKHLKSYIVNNISLPVDASSNEAFSVARGRLKKLGISCSDAEFSIYRRSVDARKRNDIQFVYSVLARGNFAPLPENAKAIGITEDKYSEPVIVFGEEIAQAPVVVGSGPCGLFAALLLAEQGYNPILIERGGSVSERKKLISDFSTSRILDTSTNIQFGAGGAGTFSDGKLVTRINDPVSGYVLRTLVKFGAPEEILYLAKPHIGTDILSLVVDNIINEIRRLGGQVLFHTELLGFKEREGGVASVITSQDEINCGAVILAIGHSARDTYSMLLGDGFNIEAKDFSVGMRIEHPTEVIDRGMYGKFAGHKKLGHAEYTLSYNTAKRGVYTFCMCPGGEVVAAASETGGVVVNGMSHHARDGRNSNSAVCCSVFKSDYGATPELAIEFQRRIERAAFKAGGSDYSAPIITVGDFLDGTCRTYPTDVTPTYMNGVGVKLAPATEYLPDFVTESIKGALLDFDRKIHGFAMKSAVLTGPETRTSSPIRIIRRRETGLSDRYNNVYPAGEGAGYAGGITSAAIDGIKTALAVMKRYKPLSRG